MDKLKSAWANFKTWWGGSKLWQKVAVVFAIIFLFNILLGACAGPRSGQANYGQQPYYDGQQYGGTTVIHQNSGGGFWSTMGGFLGGYWLGSRNRGYNDYDRNNYNNDYNRNQKQYNNQPSTVQPKNEYKPSQPSTPSTVKPKNEYKPSQPTVSPKPKNDYKPSSSPSKPSGGSSKPSNSYKPK